MIKNLPLQLNEAGRIKIGMKGEKTTSGNGKEFRLPVKLDHFLLTTTSKDDAGDFTPDVDLMERIKKDGSGLVNADGNLIGIPVRLLYDSVDQNFPTRYACYSGKHLACYGDGEKSFKRIDDYKKEHPCPCDRLAPEYDGKNRCKVNGRLICMIDQAGLFGQAHTFRTTSINSVKGIWAGMELIRAATKGRLAGLPLMLTLTGKITENGTVYVVSVVFRGTMEDLRSAVYDLAVKEREYLLEAPQGDCVVVEPGTEDEADFVDEFYPDAACQATEELKNPVNETNGGSNATGQVEPHDKATGKEVTSGPTFAVDLTGRLIEEKSQYHALYNRFLIALNENDREDALKLANRLTKDFLALFFERERPDVEFEDGTIKKTDYIAKLEILLEDPAPILLDPVPVAKEKTDATEKPGKEEVTPEIDQEDPARSVVTMLPEIGEDEHEFLHELVKIANNGDQKAVADAMTVFFKPIPVNRTLDISGLIAQARTLIGREVEKLETEQAEKATTTPPQEKPVFYDNEDDPVQDDQLRTMVQLKNKLETRGITRPEDWPDFVRQYMDKDGAPAKTAKDLSFAQGDSLINDLNEKLPEADRITTIFNFF